MEKAKYFLWALVGITSLWSLMGLFHGGSGKTGGGIRENQILSEVSSAAQVIECGYSDSFSTVFTPTQAIKNYLNLIDTTKGEADEILKQAGKIPQKPVKYIIGKPDAPWEVVLRPNNQENKVTVLGFGDDLNEPLVVKEVLCE